jgi:hypothetical protein
LPPGDVACGCDCTSSQQITTSDVACGSDYTSRFDFSVDVNVATNHVAGANA